MKSRSHASGSGMFLIEILLAIMIFAVAAAICLQVFVTAHQIARESSRLNNAVILAQSGAECFKAASGDLEETAVLLGGMAEIVGETLALPFDKEWNPAEWENHEYILEIQRMPDISDVIDGKVTVSDKSGEIIFTIPATAMEVIP